MKVIAAYLLAGLGGNVKPSAADLKHILGSVGADAEDDMIELLISQVKGKTIEELIAAGREKFVFSSSLGGDSTGLSLPSPAASVPVVAVEEKKEEKVEEEEEEDFDFDLYKDVE
ncbi:hypothetical protein GIB67_022235 [Kingdonia uniflora]|uniref:60S acidic ribosomal protein P2 n=1 Tax=Kingdonia uniflora TaxID=39325 RepID=A0A7J7M6W9_9MAGN|nr:hypothetical protein GIB67_022235 [Kingdonia uniflora]